MVSTIEQQIRDCIEERKGFILDAGAGSGKTYTLIQSLNYVLAEKGKALSNRNQKVVCITYTNVAKNEIIERTEFNPLIQVSTIHDFLWTCLKPFQKELQEALVHLVTKKLEKAQADLAGAGPKAFKTKAKAEEKIAKRTADLEALKSKMTIRYENFPRYSEGIFWHQDLLEIGEEIFSTYPIIHKLVSDSFPYIFVDEYQDTNEKVVTILLKYLLPKTNQVIGFFGDKFQQIYSDGIGEIPSDYQLEVVQKTENYRSSLSVIALLNRIRDDLQQTSPKENTANGDIVFYYKTSNEDFTTSGFVADTLLSRWRLEGTEQIKTLHLTHRFIAKENGYENLFKLYSDFKKKDSVIQNYNNRGYEPCADYLFDIERLFRLFEDNKIQEFLDKSEVVINSHAEKKSFNDLMKIFLPQRKRKTIKEVIDFAGTNNISPIPNKMERYTHAPTEEQTAFFDALMESPFSEFQSLFDVHENIASLNTKHSTKGSEFDNVFVLVNDDAWKGQYNFNNYFSGTETSTNRERHTRNMFYVTCSRAKKNLGIVCTSPLSEASQERVKVLFGSENFIEF